MHGGAIAFMLAEFVARIPRIHLDHDAVARDFGEDAGGGDAEAEPVATHQRRLWNGEGANRETVDQHVIGYGGERGDGATHRFVGRTQDIQPVDLLALDDGERPKNRFVAGDFSKESVAFAGGESLGVVQLRVMKAFRQHDCCRDDWSSERASASFIDPGHTQATG